MFEEAKMVKIELPPTSSTSRRSMAADGRSSKTKAPKVHGWWQNDDQDLPMTPPGLEQVVKQVAIMSIASSDQRRVGVEPLTVDSVAPASSPLQLCSTTAGCKQPSLEGSPNMNGAIARQATHYLLPSQETHLFDGGQGGAPLETPTMSQSSSSSCVWFSPQVRKVSSSTTTRYCTGTIFIHDAPRFPNTPELTYGENWTETEGLRDSFKHQDGGLLRMQGGASLEVEDPTLSLPPPMFSPLLHYSHVNIRGVRLLQQKTAATRSPKATTRLSGLGARPRPPPVPVIPSPLEPRDNRRVLKMRKADPGYHGFAI